MRAGFTILETLIDLSLFKTGDRKSGANNLHLMGENTSSRHYLA